MVRGSRNGDDAWGVGLFIQEGAYTTLAAAVSMLMVLALLFSAALGAWSMSRAGDVQVSADAAALAGSNVVSSYRTAATVVDAAVLSLGLTGMAMVGAGLVGTLVPGVSAAAGETVQMGVKLIRERNEFARSASQGLQTLEGAVPYLVAANAARVCEAQSTDAMSVSGTAIASPWESASDFPALAGQQIETGELEEAAASLGDVADELAQASEESAARKEAAWLADCGRDGMNMRERAAALSSISDAENPAYASSITWEPAVALKRAQAYYRTRRDEGVPDGTSVEAQVDAAARHAFYVYASEELARARIDIVDGHVVSTLELLPKNMEEVKETRLYTQAIWPTTQEEAGLTLHFSAACPGATGGVGPACALSSVGTSTQRCRVCLFSVGDVGKAVMPSTTIDNGFEYHLREFTIALYDYAVARDRELEIEQRASSQARVAGSSFEEALSVLAGKRPRIAPPGRYGCVALVTTDEIDAPQSLEAPWSPGVSLGRRAAISAAALAPDVQTSENNVLATFMASLERRGGSATVSGILGDVMDLWGDLLMAYGDMSEGLGSLMDDLLDGMTGLGAGPIASWLGERVRGAVSSLGLEPVDLRLFKPVLTDSAGVIEQGGLTGLSDLQATLRSLHVGTTDPTAVLEELGYRVERKIDGSRFTIAQIPLPGGGSIPLTVGLGDLFSVAGGG